MDYVTRQFVFLVKKFRKELRLYLSELRNALQEQTKAISQAAHASNRQQGPPPQVTVENKLPDSIQVHQNTKDTSDERNYKRAVFFMTALSFGGFAIYSTLVYWQYQESIIAMKAAVASAKAARDLNVRSQHTFEIDERPYLVAENKAPEFVDNHGLVPEQKIEINASFKNIGRTPAIMELTQIRLAAYHVHRKRSGESEKAFKDEQGKRLKDFMDRNFTELRAGNAKNLEEYRKYGVKGMDVAPGADYFSTTDDNVILKPEELADLMADSNGTILLYYLGVIDYTDSFGNPYETEICGFYYGSNPKLWHICDAYNTIR